MKLLMHLRKFSHFKHLGMTYKIKQSQVLLKTRMYSVDVVSRFAQKKIFFRLFCADVKVMKHKIIYLCFKDLKFIFSMKNKITF